MCERGCLAELHNLARWREHNTSKLWVPLHLTGQCLNATVRGAPNPHYRAIQHGIPEILGRMSGAVVKVDAASDLLPRAWIAVGETVISLTPPLHPY